MDKNKGRDVSSREVSWSYKAIMENGSEELKSIVTFITQDHPPGIPTKEGKKDESKTN